MSFPRFILIGTVAVFGLIGFISVIKKKPEQQPVVQKVYEIPLEEEQKEVIVTKVIENHENKTLPSANRIEEFFNITGPKLPIVETVTYTSRVPWLSGRPAWIADYASHYSTTRHFIARSVNHKADYFTQKVALGDRFNVLRADLNIEFHLVIDISRCKMWFYYVDHTNNQKVLLKTYDVGLGRKDEKRTSKILTPLGKYQLGEKVAIYKPGTMGYFQDQKIEMIQVFGTRWIPFEKELSGCTEPAKGFGIHGAPWVKNSKTDQLVEDKAKVGTYDSDGCIRLASDDIEELFSIIITKPTTVELVNDFFESDFAGIEKNDEERL